MFQNTNRYGWSYTFSSSLPYPNNTPDVTYLPGESVCSATLMKTRFNPKSTNTHTMRRKTITEKRLKDIKEVCSQIERAWAWKSADVCPHRCTHPNQYTEMSGCQSTYEVKHSENELTNTHKCRIRIDPICEEAT